MTARPQSITRDISTLTNGYLAALKSNSDEIARLAEAIRQAEAERDAALEDAERLAKIIVEMARAALAAHAAAKKQVTP